MTSTIKVNNIQNQCGQNIINENSNTITIGASGDTVALASGASQSGFGRSGSVDWQTTPKTANFTAVAGKGYPINTTGGAITMTLPASASAGDTIKVVDYARKFGTNKLTINQNSLKFQGYTTPSPEYNTDGQAVTLTYIDTTQVTCLAKNMYFEARSEGLAGLVATTQVVFNRLESEEYPNTICGVIEQAKLSQWWLKEKGIKKPIKNKCQFSWFCDGYSDEPKDEKTYNEIYNLAEEFIAGKHKNMIDITDGAMWYHADYVHPRWANHKEVTTKVGRHIFYR